MKTLLRKDDTVIKKERRKHTSSALLLTVPYKDVKKRPQLR